MSTIEAKFKEALLADRVAVRQLGQNNDLYRRDLPDLEVPGPKFVNVDECYAYLKEVEELDHWSTLKALCVLAELDAAHAPLSIIWCEKAIEALNVNNEEIVRPDRVKSTILLYETLARVLCERWPVLLLRGIDTDAQMTRNYNEALQEWGCIQQKSVRWQLRLLGMDEGSIKAELRKRNGKQ